MSTIVTLPMTWMLFKKKEAEIEIVVNDKSGRVVQASGITVFYPDAKEFTLDLMIHGYKKIDERKVVI